ncbi:MAG: acyl carrier protein [Deltaproteobacteria bacterium]|jgi:acyl carrier protein|nr:acyl carrier protein [Myxococcales bacterium]MDP3220537.1 acyl carrier protein [Deltaproteobacteria bacterium]
MPTPPTLKEDLRALIAEIIEKDVDAVGDDVLLRDLGVDSMQAIEIISDIERRYQIKIAESEFKNISTLASVHRFVDEKLSAR